MNKLVLNRIETSGVHCKHMVEVMCNRIRLQVYLNTGNWHPAGKPWTCEVHADVSEYDNPGLWRYGLAAHGSSRAEAVMNAYRFAKSNTMRLSDEWLTRVLGALGEINV